jgi:hypothetical protein
VKLDPVEHRVISNRSGVGGTLPKRLTVALAGGSNLLRGDRRERHEVQLVDFDLPSPHPIAPARLDLWSTPKTEGNGDVSGYHRLAQLGAELHVGKLPAQVIGISLSRNRAAIRLTFDRR